MNAPGPFYSNWGPRDGPIHQRDESPALGVFDSPEAASIPIGMAFPVGLVAGRRAPIKTFRLLIGKEELEGRWICQGRRFVRLGDAAEEMGL